MAIRFSKVDIVVELITMVSQSFVLAKPVWCKSFSKLTGIVISFLLVFLLSTLSITILPILLLELGSSH